MRYPRELIIGIAIIRANIQAIIRVNIQAIIRVNIQAKTLVYELARSYGVNVDRVTMAVEIDNVPLAIDAAIPWGLIINELVSNSLRNAFPDRKGEITISLRSVRESIELQVGDNGVGIPKDIDFRMTETLGFLS